MRILVTNDDGVRSPGLEALVEVALEFGEVKFAAPDRERSACGHAMTLNDPLRTKDVIIHGVEGCEVSGVPVDCVNVGLTVLWPEGCDLVLSGINNGPNLGFDITYSGTVAGAMEACINKIPALAFSMGVLNHKDPVHFETAQQWIRENLKYLLALELPPRTFLNINIPNLPLPVELQTRVVPMGQRVYEDRVELRHDPWGRPYYWQGGNVIIDRSDTGTDLEAIRQGFVSVTPITLDWTNHEAIPLLANQLGSKQTSS